MLGLFSIAGQFLMPFAQVSLWVLGLRGRDLQAEDQAALSNAQAMDASNDEVEPSVAEAQDYLEPGLRTYPPGTFPQLDTDFEFYAGTTDWGVSLADASIDAPTRLTDTFARVVPDIGKGEQLVVHAVISDNNGLSEPKLKAAAEQSLSLSQSYFSGAALAEITIDLISTTTAQIEWRGKLGPDFDAFYYPLEISIADEAGFNADFATQVPVLANDIDM